MNYKKFDDFVIGFKGTFTRKVTQKDNDLFRKLSGDENPLHFDEITAKKAGFDAKISNGFVTESRLAAALVKTFTSEKCAVVELKKNTRFLKPVFMNDEITATVEVIEKIEAMQALKIHALCFNQNNEKVIETYFIIQILSLQ